MNHGFVRSLLLFALSATVMAAPLGSAFTYQGELRISGQPANGVHDFEVVLFNVAGGGVALDTQVVADTPVTQGLFALTLDFTNVPFASATQYYLELHVRDGASSGTYTTLLPRQPIRATPYALQAASVASTGLYGTAPARPSYTMRFITLAGTSPTVAGDSSVTIGDDGLPIISVFDSANGDLVVMHCEDPTCAQITQTVLDSAGIVGRGNSIIVARNGLAAISYIDSTNGDLKLARCSNRSCTSATTSIVDANVGDSRRSVVITGIGGAIGMVDVFYHDANQGDVESATCAPDGTCTFATIESTDNAGQALDAVRFGNDIVVAYRDDTLNALRYKVCSVTPGNCALAATRTADAAGVPADVSMVVPPDGRPVFLYVRGSALRAVRCDTPQCVTPAASTLVYSDVAFVAATLGSDGLPLAMALEATLTANQFIKCGNLDCTSVIVGGTAGSLTVDARPAVTLGAHGNPIGVNKLNNTLVLWICDTPECAQARRR